jgi:hypothetical protein
MSSPKRCQCQVGDLPVLQIRDPTLKEEKRFASNKLNS